MERIGIDSIESRVQLFVAIEKLRHAPVPAVYRSATDLQVIDCVDLIVRSTGPDRITIT
jgi:hypothetical protein